MSTADTITIERDSGRADLILDRPDKHNALSPEMYREISEALDALAEEEVQVLVVTGAGESFCAGNDLEKYMEEPRRRGGESVKEVRELARETLTKFNDFPAMTVAKVNGRAIGGGYVVHAICDLAVAAEKASFCFSEINFGVFPGGGAMWAAFRTMNRRDAMYYCSTGETFTGEKAAEMGVVNDAVPGDELDATVDSLAETLLEKEPLALQYVKKLSEKVRNAPLEGAHELELANMDQLNYYQGPEWLDEGISQFKSGDYKPGEGDSYERSEE